MSFPKTLRELGYWFDKERGDLVTIKDKKPFVYDVKKDDPDYNQAHYEALGEACTEYIYNHMETKYNLIRKTIPLDAKITDPHSFVFVSKTFDTSKKLMIIVHGSGVVRAGQWSRRLVINEGLCLGAIGGYLRRAELEGYAVIVTNTNLNTWGKDEVKIPGSETPLKHAIYVWKHLVQPCAAEYIAITAHSYGGVVAMNLCSKFQSDFERRVFCIALSDSVHSIPVWEVKNYKHFIKVACNWVQSDKLRNTPIERKRNHNKEVKMVSAETLVHEETPSFCCSSIFNFMEDKLVEAGGERSPPFKKLRW